MFDIKCRSSHLKQNTKLRKGEKKIYKSYSIGKTTILMTVKCMQSEFVNLKNFLSFQTATTVATHLHQWQKFHLKLIFALSAQKRGKSLYNFFLHLFPDYTCHKTANGGKTNEINAINFFLTDISLHCHDMDTL